MKDGKIESFDELMDLSEARNQQNGSAVALSDGLCLLDGFVEALLGKVKTDEYFTTVGQRSYRYCEGVTDTLKIIKEQIIKIREQA